MNNQTLTQCISIAIQTGTPYIVWGSPGIGKSSLIEAICRALDVYPMLVPASGLQPPDLLGWPAPDLANNKLRFLPAYYAQRALELSQSGHKVHLFLDELSNATPACQAVLLTPIQTNRVGEAELSRGLVSWGAAANPPSEAAEGYELRAPMANRFVHFHMGADVEGWISGMLTGWPQVHVPTLPDKWREEIPQARATIVGFINAQRLAFHNLSESTAGGAWPSPRTWDMFSCVLAATRSLGYKDTNEVPAELARGLVGEGATKEWLAYSMGYDLPDPEEVLKNPKLLSVKKLRDDQVFSALASVVAAVVAKNTKARWLCAWAVLEAVIVGGKPDIATIQARLLISNPPANLNLKDTLPKELDKIADFLEEANLISGNKNE